MKRFAMLFLVSVSILGCSAHQPDTNLKMMDKVVGELDRETSK